MQQERSKEEKTAMVESIKNSLGTWHKRAKTIWELAEELSDASSVSPHLQTSMVVAAKGFLICIRCPVRAYVKTRNVLLHLLHLFTERAKLMMFNARPTQEELVAKAVNWEDLRQEMNRCLLVQLLKGLSFSGVIDVFGRLIPQMETSAKLCLLLTLLREFIRLKWPGTANDVDPAAFKELRGLLNWMFTSGALQFNPTDSEEDDKNRPRGFLEQLETVEAGVNVYLLIVWLEVKGGTDYCGLLATSEQVRDSWLTPLLEQEVEITEPLFNNYLKVARSVIEYALLVNSDPQIVIEEGLLPC